MKKILLLTVLITVPILFGQTIYGYAQGCDDKGNPAIYKLIEEKQFGQAEELAKKNVANNPNDLQNYKDLAMVYVRWASKEIVQVDERALGLKPGEQGTVALTPEMVDKAFKSEIILDPKLASKAEGVMSEILNKWPNSRQTYFCLMELQQRAGKHEDFLKTLGRTAKAFKAEPDRTIDDLLTTIYYYPSEMKRYDLAASSYEAVLVVFPDSPKLLSSYGATEMSLGFVRKGAAFLQKAYEKDPNDILIVHNMGEAALLLKNFSKAESYLRQELKLKPGNTEILFKMAMIKMAEGPSRSIPAWNAYFAAHQKHPDDESWASVARQIKEQAESGMPDESVLQLAQNLIESGTQSYAIPLITYLQKQQPREPVYHYILAHAYDSKGHYELAKEALLETAKLLEKEKSKYNIDPDTVQFNLARVSLSLNQADDSLKYLKAVEARRQDYPNIQYMLGKAYLQAGDLKTAKKYFEHCLKSDNNKDYAQYCKTNLEEL